MGFDSYEEALRSALKQSRSMLTDVKLYIKLSGDKYRIGFTPDNSDDSYIYNGEVKNDKT